MVKLTDYYQWIDPHMTLSRDELHAQFTAQAEQLGLDIDAISEGPVNAEIVIVGEGLGETEVRLKAPFVGGAGTLLFNTLRRYGIHRANTYVTNVVKRQISLSRKGNEKHIVYADELEKWEGLLQWELSELPNARIVLILGGYALSAVTNRRGITAWRGSVFDLPLPNGKLGKIVCTINPAFAQREPKQEPAFLLDIRDKFVPVVNGTFKPYTIEAIINPDAQRARKFIRDLIKAKLPVAFDIETSNNETACYGIGNDPHVAMCINLRDHVTNRYTLTEECDILLDLQELCDSLPIVAQNGQFDSYWTRLHDHLCVPIWFDILLGHHTLYPQLPHKLEFMVSQYTTHPYYKDERETWREKGDIDSFWQYNCKDVALTLAIHKRIHNELKQQGLDKFFFNHVMRATPHLISATVHGVKVDMTLKEAINKQCAEDVEGYKAEFYRHVHDLTNDSDYYPNPDSPPQMRELFFDRLGLVGRGRSTDETNRDHIMENPKTSPRAKEMLAAYTRYKKEAKFFSTYAEAVPSEDGRMRCEYRQFGTKQAPGRLSSAGLLDGTGLNLQNQPPRAREMYIADPGMVFVYFDLKQAESQVVAYRADIPKWKEQYERMRKDGSYDAHRALASDMFKVKYEMVPVYDFDPDTGEYTIRYVSKRCRHGLNYRMERFRLSEETGLPYHEAARAFTLYHHATPELKRWWEVEEREFRKAKTIYNALGRRWKVIQRINDDVLKSVVAYYPQSTIGDKITQVWYQAEEDDDWPDDARVCLDVHDNLVGLASPKTAKTALRVLRKYAESPIMIQSIITKRIEPLSIPAELKMSTLERYKGSGSKKRRIKDDTYHRWSHMKEVTL